MATRTLEALRQIPVEQVQDDLKRVRAERSRLAKEEQLLEQVLALHDAEDTAAAIRNLSAHREDDHVVVVTGGPPPASGSRRAQIQRIMAESDHTEWSPAEIIAALRERGSRARDEAIRVTLRRMLDRGQLARPRHGVYTLPSTDSATQQALDDGGTDE